MLPPESPFFDVPRSEWIAANRSAFAIWDAYPVSPGHALVITRRQISDWWEATPDERADLLALVDDVRTAILDERRPDGFNVGFNAGQAAGQTIDHLHIHVIPRYVGDVTDPRGGVRHAIPERGNYLAPSAGTDIASSAPVLVDGQVRMLLPELVQHLRTVEFDHIDIVVSFIKQSGLTQIGGALLDALARGAQVRILTTDYLGLTEPAALARLHDLEADYPDQLSVRVFHDPEVSFHPKAYLFYSSRGGAEAAFVGSSNLSGSGLAGGIEWNLLVGSIGQVKDRFLVLWLDRRSLPLTDALIAAYQPAPPHVPAVVEVIEQPALPPEPRPIQREALDALVQTRNDDFRAGMVTMATGLGKTWLAAFDVARPEFRRVLFVAHREEILKQSRDVFRLVMPTATLGLYYGEEKRPDADIVFASVQTLSRHLDVFAPDAFDYIVVDEFHHAAATSYRKVLDHFTPRFLLGLTATPDRMDGADLLALCADNLVYQCDLVEGIRRNELVPFHYWGVADPVDFEPIPWRGGRFDPAALEAAVATQERAQASYDEWLSRRGSKTLAFCASMHHADFTAEFFRERGVRAVSVHSGPSSAPRHESLDELRAGELDVVFAVDLFNEGLDVPDIDTVLMLRPTESSIIFLQQLGRGLRIREGKDGLTVIDFIGNHRSFLMKPRTLLSLARGETPTMLQVFTAMTNKEFDLPPGCSIDYELGVVDMLRELTRSTARDAIEEYCRSHFEDEGLRPTAAQAFRAGHDPSAVTAKYGSWFGFLRAVDLLGRREAAAFDRYGEVLRGFQTESVTKSYKLVTVRALIHDDALRTGVDITRNAETSRELLLADPRLARDVPVNEFPHLADAPANKWATYWRKWPISHLTGTGDSAPRPHALFRISGDRIEPTFEVDDESAEVFESMVAEIIDYRLANYVLNKEKSSTQLWRCRLAHADGEPVIRLDRRVHTDLPTGRVDVVADGVGYELSFNRGVVAFGSREGSTDNALPGLLRDWFGRTAGHSHTHDAVEFERVDGTLLLRPAADSESGDGAVDQVPLFSNYDVAFRPGAQQSWHGHASTEIPIRRSSGRDLSPAKHFACFATHDSPDESGQRIRRGDPLLFEWLGGDATPELIGETVLIGGAEDPGAGVLKVMDRNALGLSGVQPIARLVAKLDQAEVNPLQDRIGEQCKSTQVPPLYGLVHNPGNWQQGHVSLDEYAVLLVTLEPRADRSQYLGRFEARDVFEWSSQASTAPDGKKGREILESLETGKPIELWMRQKSTQPFSYLGRVAPLSHKGSRPMLVTFRLMTPLSGELESRLGVKFER